MPFDAGYCFCVYTLNRKCHILGVNVTLQQHFKDYEAKLDEATTVTRLRPVIMWSRPVFWASRPRPGRGLNIPAEDQVTVSPCS